VQCDWCCVSAPVAQRPSPALIWPAPSRPPTPPFRPPARFLDDAGGEAAATARRHGAFKIIPRVTTGSWMVKQAVGQNTPVLLGRKITTKYFRCARGDAG